MKKLRMVWAVIILGLIMVACGRKDNNESTIYPFKTEPLGVDYTQFISAEGYQPNDITIILEDDQRVWFSFPKNIWHQLDGEIQGIYDPSNGKLFDIRFEVYATDFSTVVQNLRTIYADISAQDYVALDTSWWSQPDWQQLTASRYERRVNDGQLALFVTDDYRIEVWNEAYFANEVHHEPTVSIIYLLK